jgi:hypothetical protein
MRDAYTVLLKAASVWMTAGALVGVSLSALATRFLAV